jgi:hypothetical protein
MQTEQKQHVTASARAYMEEKGLTAVELSTMSKVNQTYMSQILNGIYVTTANDKEVEIKDQYFHRIAEAIGMPLRPVYWKTILTPQMSELLASLEHAKTNCMASTLICPTGMGKTWTIERFKERNPKHTYVFTVNSLVKVHDVINWLLEELRVPTKGMSKAKKLITIVTELRKIRREGGFPLIAFDEMENAPLPLVKFVKGLFDGMKHGDTRYGAIVQLGTDQLLTKMTRLKFSNTEAGPQYYRRFKAGIREISTRCDFAQFFDAVNLKDRDLRKMLEHLCDNYGELNSYLEPALREAHERGEELNEDFFRRMYNMPNTKR